jgi:hypothetical protein
MLWQVVQEVWYLRENAGIAELLGADAKATQTRITTTLILAMILASRARLFMTDPPHPKLEGSFRIYIPGFEFLSIVEYSRYLCGDTGHQLM